MAGVKDLTIPKLSKYQERCLEIAKKAYETLNATDKEVAELLQVTPSTLARWKDVYPDFGKAIDEAKEYANQRVVSKLYERATGYNYPAQKVMQHKGQELIVDYTVHSPPDMDAIKFWLTNRDPEHWRSVTSQEISGPRGGPIPVININFDMNDAPKLPDIEVKKEDEESF